MGDDAASKEVGASAALNNHGGVRDDNILLQLNDNPDTDEIEVVQWRPFIARFIIANIL